MNFIWIALIIFCITLLIVFCYCCCHSSEDNNETNYVQDVHVSSPSPDAEFIENSCNRLEPSATPELGFGFPINMPQPEFYQTPTVYTEQSAHIGFRPMYATEETSYPPETSSISPNVPPYPTDTNLNNMPHLSSNNSNEPSFQQPPYPLDISDDNVFSHSHSRYTYPPNSRQGETSNLLEHNINDSTPFHEQTNVVPYPPNRESHSVNAPTPQSQSADLPPSYTEALKQTNMK